MKHDREDNEREAPLGGDVLSQLERGVSPPRRLEARVIAELRRVGVLRRRTLPWLVVASAAGIAFVAGVFIGRSTARPMGHDMRAIDIGGQRVALVGVTDASILPVIEEAVKGSVARAPLVATPAVPRSTSRSITWF